MKREPMQVVVWCGGSTDEWRQAGHDGPPSLLRVVDRPMVQHVIESIADAGCRYLHLVCDEQHAAVAEFAGTGTRWGVDLFTWRVTDLAPGGALRVGLSGVPVLFGTATTLPLQEDGLLRAGHGNVRIVAGPGHAWTGWSHVDAATWPDLTWVLTRDGGIEPVSPVPMPPVGAPHLLDVRTPAGLLASEALLLDGIVPGLELAGRQVQPGVWIGRGATIHASANLVAPVHIGPRAHVGAHADVGPYVVLGAGCVVDQGTALRHASVVAETYLGPELDIVASVVGNRRVIDTHHGAVVPVSDRSLLDCL